MLRSALRRSLVLVAISFAGCGPATGIEPGIPKDTTPSNPTPDMAPNPPKTKI